MHFLLATKLLMAGHNVTPVCREKTAETHQSQGNSKFRVKSLRDGAERAARSSRRVLQGRLDATTPADVKLFALRAPVFLAWRSADTPTTRSGF